MENTNLNIYQKLLEIQRQVIGLGKDKESFSFKYVTGSKVLEHVKPLMNKYGLLLKQEVISIGNSRQDYNTKNASKSEILTKVMMRFTWIDAETGQTDVSEFGANGQNDWEKGLGSALTYAERYFLLKYFHIATDEDDIDNPERKAQAEAEAKKALDNAIKEVKACKDKACTVQVWNKYPQLKEVEAFKTAVSDKGNSFTAEEKKTTEEPVNDVAAKKEEPITSAQQEQLLKLINSSVFTQKEKDDTVASMPKLTKVRASKAIEWALGEIKTRKEAKKGEATHAS